MCERAHNTEYKIQVYVNGQPIGPPAYAWDKTKANRIFDKQAKKDGTTVVMWDPQGRKIRG